MTAQHFGTWLKSQLRARPGGAITESEFARQIDRPASMVNRWVRGERLPSSASCELISEKLGIPVEVVLYHAGHLKDLRSFDPDDPRALIDGLVDRIDWSKKTNVKLAQRVLLSIIEADALDND